jgi:hypothetical protein
VAFSLSFPVFSQDCGTVLPPKYGVRKIAYNNKEYKKNGTNKPTAYTNALMPHDTCLKKKLSVVFYVFLDSTGAPGVTQAQINACIDTLNRYFDPICITFESCSTKYVPEYEYNEWDKTVHEPKMVGNYNYYTEKTINIYLVSNLMNPGGNGYAHMPGSSRDLIVLRKSALSGLTPVHEMGHYFGLPHTFDQIGTATEVVVRTNCFTDGDGFCDTDADPFPTGSWPAICNYQYGPKDSNNDYYVPPVDNIMSYWTCRCRFTQEQYNFMAYIYVTARSYLH